MIKYIITEKIVILDFKNKINSNEYIKTWYFFRIPIYKKHYKNTYEFQDDVKENKLGLR